MIKSNIDKKTARKKRLGMAIYVLPNLFTTGNMFWGFFSIVRSFEGRHKEAAFAILAAAIFDVLDGRIARLTKTTSDFGIQFDSLADLISFCLAPALLALTIALNGFGRMGWTLCFFYFVSGALRLARFNVQTTKLKDKNFIGLPSPTAALILATFIIFIEELKTIIPEINFSLLKSTLEMIVAPATSKVFITLATPTLGFLMVSHFRYSSFKDLKLKNTRPFYTLVWLVAVFTIIASKFELLAFPIMFLYTLSGPFLYFSSAKHRKPIEFVATEEVDEHDFHIEEDYQLDQIAQKDVEIEAKASSNTKAKSRDKHE